MPSMVTDTVPTPSESQAFQVSNPLATDTATWLIVGPWFVTWNIPLYCDQRPELSVAVMT